jgi:uncharacterized protein YciI
VCPCRRRLAELHATGKLVMAGPWEDESGALLLFDTDRSAVDAILAAGPYYTTAGVTIAALRQWCRIAGDRPSPAAG